MNQVRLQELLCKLTGAPGHFEGINTEERLELDKLVQQLILENELKSRALRDCTHPAIHIDFYDWWPTPEVQNYLLNKEQPVSAFDAAMYAWSRSRETVNERRLKLALAKAKAASEVAK